MSTFTAFSESADVTNVNGMVNMRNPNRPSGWESKLAKFNALVENHSGAAPLKWKADLQEAVSRADFPALYADTLDREMTQRYKAISPIMYDMLQQRTLTTFREVKRFMANTGTGSLPEVEENARYAHRDKGLDFKSYSPKKYGALTGFSFEAFIDDDVDFFSDTALDLAQAAANTRERLLAGLFFDVDGPRDDFFGSGTAQNGVSNKPLTKLNLEFAIQEMMGNKADGSASGYRDSSDEPILNEPRYLMVPPSLQLTAEELLSPAALISGNTTPNTSENIIARRGIKLIVNPWMGVITSGVKSGTQWALFSGTIKAGEVGRLKGHEGPELFMRSSGAVSLSGSETNPFSGSFDEDSIDYKVRYIQGQTQLDTKGGWASDGQ